MMVFLEVVAYLLYAAVVFCIGYNFGIDRGYGIGRSRRREGGSR